MGRAAARRRRGFASLGPLHPPPHSVPCRGLGLEKCGLKRTLERLRTRVIPPPRAGGLRNTPSRAWAPSGQNSPEGSSSLGPMRGGRLRGALGGPTARLRWVGDGGQSSAPPCVLTFRGSGTGGNLADRTSDPCHWIRGPLPQRSADRWGTLPRGSVVQGRSSTVEHLA